VVEAGAKFTPFAIESYGALDKEAVGLVESMARELEAKYPEEYEYARALNFLKEQVSVALQKGNAQAFNAHLAHCRAKHRDQPRVARAAPWDAGDRTARSFPALTEARARAQQLAPPAPKAPTPQPSSLEAAAQKISLELERRGRQVVRIAGDGDCAPLAIVKAMELQKLADTPDLSTAKLVRTTLHKYVTSRLFEPRKKAVFGTMSVIEFQQWCEDLRKPRRHQDAHFFKAVGDMLGADVVVYKMGVFANGQERLTEDYFSYNKKHVHPSGDFTTQEWSSQEALIHRARTRKIEIMHTVTRRSEEVVRGGAELYCGHYDLVIDGTFTSLESASFSNAENQGLSLDVSEPENRSGSEGVGGGVDDLADMVEEFAQEFGEAERVWGEQSFTSYNDQ
jgi:hypothetical protein